jgi:hypothetical protein
MAKLTLDDIADLRAYEREREAFRERVIALKRDRRIGLGPVLTLVFENELTIRFQVQEMARAERMLSDEQIQGELDTYNRLIPDAGQLSATVFIELTTRAEMEEWLPKLVGIERSLYLDVAGQHVEATVEEEHAAQLTREEITAAVHFVRFELDSAAVAAFPGGPVTLGSDHPMYRYTYRLDEASRVSLAADLEG